MRRLMFALAVSVAGVLAVIAASAQPPVTGDDGPPPKVVVPPGMAVATFAGGCFWCMEAPFDKLDGVLATTSGFMGGHTPNPTYRQVTRGDTGHAEVVHVVYDPSKIGYQKLLDTYWVNVDPYDGGGQFCDRGDEYRTAIFYHSEEQKRLAEATKAKLMASGPLKQPIVTQIVAAGPFTAAGAEHQDYYLKNPVRYGWYRRGCGRDLRLEAIWGRPKS